MLSKFRHEIHFLILFLVLGMLFDSLIREEVEVNCFGDLVGGLLHGLRWPRKSELLELLVLPPHLHHLLLHLQSFLQLLLLSALQNLLPTNKNQQKKEERAKRFKDSKAAG